MLHFDVRRENHDPHIRILVANCVRRLETFRRVRGGHADVDEQQVGHVLAARLDRVHTIPCLSDNVEARALEQTG